MPDMTGPPLIGKVAVVTGASRGAGRAIAIELGRWGATVYVTGRSTRAAGSTEDMPGTIEETAGLVTGAGGHGVAMPVDHTRDEQVATLFATVEREEGRLEILVNNAWGGYEHHDVGAFVAPFWEQPLSRWDGMFTAGLRASFVSSRYAAPLLIRKPGGLIVNTVAWAFGDYLGNLYYDVAKAAMVRMSYGMARELEPHGGVALAVAPGFMRTERVMAAHAQQPFDLSQTESPEYLARAVAALAADPAVGSKSGQVVTAGELAREYGFTDDDGRRPAPFRMPTE